MMLVQLFESICYTSVCVELNHAVVLVVHVVGC